MKICTSSEDVEIQAKKEGIKRGDLYDKVVTKNTQRERRRGILSRSSDLWSTHATHETTILQICNAKIKEMQFATPAWQDTYDKRIKTHSSVMFR